MRDGRHLAALLVVLGAFALAVPAVALAGGSAGNNQYTNPFGGGTTLSRPTTPPQTSSTTAPETTTSAPRRRRDVVAPATGDRRRRTPNHLGHSDQRPDRDRRRLAGAGTTTAGKGLPRTGYAVWEIAGFGLVMIAGGFVIRRRARRA